MQGERGTQPDGECLASALPYLHVQSILTTLTVRPSIPPKLIRHRLSAHYRLLPSAKLNKMLVEVLSTRSNTAAPTGRQLRLVMVPLQPPLLLCPNHHLASTPP